jgi:hypothetical protein
MSDFESIVLEKLSSIEARLSGLEDKFDEASSFADDILSDENGLFGGEGLGAIRSTLSTFMPSQDSPLTGEDSDMSMDSLKGLVGSLQDFREKLSGIRSAIDDMPANQVSTPNEDQD